MNAALGQNLELLEQGVHLLQGLDDSVYRATRQPHETSHRVGPHLRHCIDAYRCLLDGLARGVVDYDARSRDRQVETDREAGLTALTGLLDDLRALGSTEPDRPVMVRVDTPPGVDETEAAGRSTFYRELQFLVGHTVHHYALIAMILRQHGVDPGREFGVAPSTLRYWQSEEAARA